MSEPTSIPAPATVQLGQARVEIKDAPEVFSTPGADGHTPIVIVVARPSRIPMNLVMIGGLAIAGGIVARILGDGGWLAASGIVAGLIIIGIGVVRSFFVQVPEGASGLLVRKGVHAGVVGPGSHVIPPWIALSHLVTRREVPYDAIAIEAPTRDNVRAWVDSLITFSITDPYRFVYAITATDFDAVLAAASQDALRRMVRTLTWDQVSDLRKSETDTLRQALTDDVAAYGATITRVTITYARPPVEFLRSEEARQLAVLRRAEQAEEHTLAQRRQADEDDLEHQRTVARVERGREELLGLIQNAETRRGVVELETEAMTGRLAKLEEALDHYPHAAKYEFEGAQLEAVRALAANSRAVVQMGSASDVGRAFVIRDILNGAIGEAPPPEDPERPAAAPDRNGS